jgi:DNA-binding CsgD family transcriptional regulator
MQPSRDLSDDLGTAIRELELPITLVDLDDFTVCAASESAAKLIGLPASGLVGRSAVELPSAEDRPNVAAALEVLRSGGIDFYRAHRRWDEADGSEGLRTSWVRAVEFGGKRFAFIEVAAGSEPRQSPLAAYLGREPVPMAIGTVDPSWIITAISSDITALLGLAPEEVCGRQLLGAVARDDVRHLLDAGLRVHEERSVALRIQLRDGAGAWTPLCCVLSPLAGERDRLFILMPDVVTSPRAVAAKRSAQLERHLSKIAAEVAASGILHNIGVAPDASHVAQLGQLSLRQWEVLTRLLRGERVSVIATALFISQSTVRNHLSAIFERFGVHSQAELLSLLQEQEASPS